MTPLRQALSEALEKFDDTPGRPCYICGGHSKHDDDCLYRVARELLPALDASATTARETPEPPPLWQHAVNECNAAHVSLDKRGAPATKMVRKREGQGEHPITLGLAERIAALPSTAPPAPPATPDDYERGFQAGWNHSLHLLGPQQDVAPRRAETPTNRPPADAKEWTCDECGNDLLWCKHGRKAAALPLPSPAPPEGPRDAPAQATCRWTEDSGGYWTTTCGKLFTAGRLSESHYRFCPYCGLTLQPVVFDDAVSADGAPGGE